MAVSAAIYPQKPISHGRRPSSGRSEGFSQTTQSKTMTNITIRSAEPDDYEGICEAMSQPIAQANTLQLPYPALEMWKKRLAGAASQGYFRSEQGAIMAPGHGLIHFANALAPVRSGQAGISGGFTNVAVRDCNFGVEAP